MKTRGRKIFADIWARKGRTALVSLSIMVGVFGVALLVGVGDIFISTLRADMPPDKIAQIKMYTVLPFGELDAEATNDILAEIEAADDALPGLEHVEAQAVYALGWKFMDDPAEGRYRDGNVISYTVPFEDVQLEPVSLREGRFPEAGANEVAVDVRFAETQELGVGDTILLEPIDSADEPPHVTIVGLAYQPFFVISPAAANAISADTYIFAAYEDAQALTEFGGASAIYARYGNYEQAESNLDAFTQYISRETPYIAVFPFTEDPDDIFIVDQVNQVVSVLNSLAIVAMVVSGFLVINVINTIIVEQKKQIGVMKSLGASRLGIFVIYAGIALVYGVIGTVLGLLLAIPATSAMAESLAFVALTYVEPGTISTNGLITGAILGILVPVLVAIIPVFNGTRVKILDAITDLGIASNWGQGRLARIINAVPAPIAVRQALSNVAQKQGRLLLTGITLMLAVAAFMGIGAVQSTIGDELDNFFDLTFDVQVSAQNATTLDDFQAAIADLDGVEDVAPGFGLEVSLEGYLATDDLRAGSDRVLGVGIEVESPLAELDFIDGGWDAVPADDGVISVALTEAVANQLEPEIGETLVVVVNGVSREVRLAGVVDSIDTALYIDWRTLATLAGFVSDTGEPQPNGFRVAMTAEDPDVDTVADFIFELDNALADAGIRADYVNLPEQAEIQSQSIGVFGFVFNITAGVMAVVGAIGLLATLSMAVFERQKEIGVMRSIGAGSGTIIAQFLTEGMIVGIIAWLVAIPISYVLGDGLLTSLPFGELTFAYPVVVIFSGLVLILLVTLVASIWPSLSAARKSVSEILRYQ